MNRLTVHFETEEGFDPEVLATSVAERLGRLEEVEAAEANVPDERVLAEAVAVITGVVLLTKAAREGVDELRKLVASLRKLVEETNGLRGAVLDIGGRKVQLDDPEEVLAAMEAAV